jgi:hypothetical protein
MYRDKTSVQCELYGCTGTKWRSHRNSKDSFTEKFGRRTRKTFNRFTTKDSCTWNITLLRRTPQSKTWSLSSADHLWMKRSTRKKRPVTRDDDDDDNNNNSTKSSAVLLMLRIRRSPLPLYGAFWACGYRKWTPAIVPMNASRKPPDMERPSNMGTEKG